MLIPINSDPIVAVIIETTTVDRKSLARRRERFKNGSFRDLRALGLEGRRVCILMRARTHTHTEHIYHSYTPLLVLSRRAVSPYAARPPVRMDLITGSIGTLSSLSQKKPGKYDGISCHFLRSFVIIKKIPLYNVINHYTLIISQK